MRIIPSKALPFVMLLTGAVSFAYGSNFSDVVISTSRDCDCLYDICEGFEDGFLACGSLSTPQAGTIEVILLRYKQIQHEWQDVWAPTGHPWSYSHLDRELNQAYSVSRSSSDSYIIAGSTAYAADPSSISALALEVSDSDAQVRRSWHSQNSPATSYDILPYCDGGWIAVGSCGEGSDESMAVWRLEPGPRQTFSEAWMRNTASYKPHQFSGERAVCVTPLQGDPSLFAVGGMNDTAGARLFIMNGQGNPVSEMDFVIGGECIRDIVAMPSVSGHSRLLVLISYPYGQAPLTTATAAIQEIDLDPATSQLSLIGDAHVFAPPEHGPTSIFRAHRLQRMGSAYVVTGSGVRQSDGKSFACLFLLDDHFCTVAASDWYYDGESLSSFQSRFMTGAALDYIGNRIDCAVASSCRSGYQSSDTFFGYVYGIGETGVPPYGSDQAECPEGNLSLSASPGFEVLGNPEDGYNFEISSSEERVTIAIFDICGRAVLSRTIPVSEGRLTMRLDSIQGYSELSAGVYFLIARGGSAIGAAKLLVLP